MSRKNDRRRLYESDGITFLKWMDPPEFEEKLAAKEIVVAYDLRRKDLEIGFKLREKIESATAILAFSRPSRPEDKFRYEIPHAGDCRTICLRRYSLRHFVSEDKKVTIGRRIIKVSARKIDFAALAFRQTLQSASNLSA